MKHILYLFSYIALFTFSVNTYAQKDPDLKFQTDFEKYTVRHVVFNSTFVLPEVAKIYNIKRSKYESMLNISLSYRDDTNSWPIKTIPTEIKGTVTNLLQQQKSLTFKEIKEKDAIYYLAPIRVANEELLHFTITLTPEGSKEPLEVRFSQTIYADE